MDLATISLWALVVVVALSCVTNANVGLLGMTLAWIIGVYIAPGVNPDLKIDAKVMASFFPVDLFITLAGVTLLFSIAQQNGTLRLVTHWGTSLCRGRAALMPVLFFLLAGGLSAAGAGNVPTVALLASSAMLAAHRLGISPMVMTIMVGHGSIAGTLSPISPMGVIADKNLTAMGLAGHTGYTFGMNFVVNATVACLGYVLFRGWRSSPPATPEGDVSESSAVAVTAAHVVTLSLLGLMLVGVLGFRVHVGFAAFAAATLLILLRIADEKKAFQEIPWSVVLMVCGMTVLVTLCEKTGGLELFSKFLAAWATPQTLTGWMAGVTGLISVFSSTSGVVLPTFLPTVPGIVGDVGLSSDRMLAVATAVNIGSNLVDVSSVSTIGAMCVAATPGEHERRKLYRQALAWGLSMSVVGAVVCWAVL